MFSARDLALIGMMAAMLEGVKVVLQSVPNVELVTFLILMFTLFWGARALPAVWVFVGMECAVWGIGLWTIMYIYIWPLLVIFTLLVKKYSDEKWAYVLLTAVFGLLFGGLCAVPYLFLGGIRTAVAWWIAGIPYDILHGISNGVICFFLYDPVRKVMTKMKEISHEI